MNTEKIIKNIITTKIIYVGPEDTMQKVEMIFDEFTIHHILVVEDTKLIGIISKNDLLQVYKSFADRNEVPNRAEVKVSSFMTHDPICLEVDDTIGLAADIFLSNKIHSVPVMNGKDLAGIITNHDLMKYCFR